MNDEERVNLMEEFTCLYLALDTLYNEKASRPSPTQITQAIEEIYEIISTLRTVEKRDYHDALSR